MKKLASAGLCGLLLFSVGRAAVLAQAATDSGGVAALEQQRGDLAKEIAAVEQKLAARRTAIDELPDVAPAKKASQAADKALNDFMAGSEVYAKLAKERSAAASASAAALEKAKVDDAEYPALRTRLNEVQAKRQEVDKKLREAAPDAQAALKEEMVGLDKQVQEINLKKTERRTVLGAKPEVVDAVKAAAAAEAAYQEFVKNNADYVKVATERGTAEAAYRKKLSDAKAGDAEYGLLQKQLADLRAKIGELDRKIAEAKQAKPAK